MGSLSRPGKMEWTCRCLELEQTPQKLNSIHVFYLIRMFLSPSWSRLSRPICLFRLKEQKVIKYSTLFWNRNFQNPWPWSALKEIISFGPLSCWCQYFVPLVAKPVTCIEQTYQLILGLQPSSSFFIRINGFGPGTSLKHQTSSWLLTQAAVPTETSLPGPLVNNTFILFIYFFNA